VPRVKPRACGVRFGTPLVEGRLVRRYQRFLADVRFADGVTVTAHCPNTGSMLGCQAPESRVWLSRAERPGRRCPYTWEMVEVEGGALVGVNTGRANQLVLEALRNGMVPEFAEYSTITPEVSLPDASVRIDFLLGAADGRSYYLEVKNVSAAVESGRAVFPDAVSERAARHANVLAGLRRQGCGAGVLFCVQRDDVREVAPADHIDPAYGRALRAAAAEGGDVQALGARVTPLEIRIDRRLPVAL
jgi:sugar fermentation stimulation protein A